MGLVGLAAAVLFSLLAPVALVGAVLVGLSRLRQSDPEPDEPGIGTVRRVFLYVLAFVSLGLASAGLALLVAGVLDALFGGRVIAESDTDLATALSLTVVGLPAFLIFLLVAQRSLQRHPVEARSLARWTYLGLVRVVALSVAVGTGIEVGRFLVGAHEFSATPWGWLTVALAMWGGHQAIVLQAAPPTHATRFLDRLYRGYGAVLGLAVLGFGLAAALTAPAQQVYEALVHEPLVSSDAWHEVLRVALVQVAIGGAVWWWHWIAGLRGESESPIWHVVVFLFGILVGLALVVWTGAASLLLVLEWAIDDPAGSAATHFADVVGYAGLFLVGLASWGYHRAVLDERSPHRARRGDAERVYTYLVAAAGLATLASGLTAAFALAVDALTPASGFVRDPEWWRGDLALILTLLVVGAPLWARYWFGAQREAQGEGVEAFAERESLPRRAFIFLVFGVAVLVVLVNLAVLLFQVFDAVLEGDFGVDTARDVRWSVAMLLTAGAISGYYWLVLRDDQAAGPLGAARTVEGAPERSLLVREVVLIAPVDAARSLGGLLSERGVRVRRWDRTDIAGVPVTGEDAEAFLVRLALTEAASVVLVVEASGEVRILPAVPA